MAARAKSSGAAETGGQAVGEEWLVCSRLSVICRGNQNVNTYVLDSFYTTANLLIQVVFVCR